MSLHEHVKNSRSNNRYRLVLHKTIREFEQREKARKDTTKLIITGMSTLFITLSSFLIISYLYLN